MESLEEITPERIRDLTQIEAKTLWDERNLLQGKIRQEMQMLVPKAFPPGKTPLINAEQPTKSHCSSCGSDDLMKMQRGYVFCRKCHYVGSPK
jgi:hypothetical protein